MPNKKVKIFNVKQMTIMDVEFTDEDLVKNLKILEDEVITEALIPPLALGPKYR